MTENYKEVVEMARRTFNSGRTLPLKFRFHQLERLQTMYRDHQQVFIDALHSDLRKPLLEAKTFEVLSVIEDINYILNRLESWATPEEVASGIPLDKSLIYPEPYGVTLVMGAWNYPLQLTMVPVHGAIAAGNTVIIKPSDVAPATAATLAKLVPQYLDQDCFPVVCGGVAEVTELLKEKFDYIFYTGSTTVGRIVREAANKHLTPVTLEMGGKSPCYIDDTVDLDYAARRILWGKMINLGQTCVAPDYLMCSRDLRERLVAKMKEVLQKWYGQDPKKSPDLGRIVAERHVDRLVGYLESGRVVVGGKYERAERWVEPTVLVDVAEDSKIMQSEIFGPILPILTVESHTQAIEIIRKKDRPLALYVFTVRKEVQEEFLQQVQCGGVCLNDTIHQIINNKLPFGGVGCSGMGAYKGKFTFDTFSHQKAVVSRSYNSLIEKATRCRFPPYSEKKIRLMTPPKDRGDGPGVLHYATLAAKHLVSMSAGALLLYLSLNYTHAMV